MTIRNWFTMFSAFARREEGQTMAEYAVILTVIAAVVITALGALVLAITGRLGAVTNVISG
ncbi:MAG: Flp family type IVb pilin [Actinomycetota bacterium]|jgi:Flp pilus assembly pilin Flp